VILIEGGTGRFGRMFQSVGFLVEKIKRVQLGRWFGCGAREISAADGAGSGEIEEPVEEKRRSRDRPLQERPVSLTRVGVNAKRALHDSKEWPTTRSGRLAANHLKK